MHGTAWCGPHCPPLPTLPLRGAWGEGGFFTLLMELCAKQWGADVPAPLPPIPAEVVLVVLHYVAVTDTAFVVLPQLRARDTVVTAALSLDSTQHADPARRAAGFKASVTRQRQQASADAQFMQGVRGKAASARHSIATLQRQAARDERVAQFQGERLAKLEAEAGTLREELAVQTAAASAKDAAVLDAMATAHAATRDAVHAIASEARHVKTAARKLDVAEAEAAGHKEDWQAALEEA